MNWVGGSRSRLVMRNDEKRQREFFEKRKMQNKLKNLGLAAPASPQVSSSGSMDLVTLFIVNQIAAKKKNKDPPKVAVLGSYKGGVKHKRNEPLVLPMSPCSPSQLSLVESQPQYSVQETRKRKHVIPQGFKCRQLSPVPESAFSDNSASDYMPPMGDRLSPFSSTASASSGQGIFPLQLNLQQRSHTQAQLPLQDSPAPWDTSALQQTEFQPFSQPRAMAECMSWSCGSDPPLYHLETPTAAPVLFEGPGPAETDAERRMRHKVKFSLSQPEDGEPMLDFTLNQSEMEQQFEDDVFRGFSTEEPSHFGRRNSKIYLKDETPAKPSAPQTVPDSQCMGVELFNGTSMNFSCLEDTNGPMNGCDCSPSHSCRGGYLSSASSDEDECCEAASSFMDQACAADSLNQNSQGSPKQKHTPPLKPQLNSRDDQKVMENMTEASGSDGLQAGRSTAQFPSPRSSQTCKCMKTSNETRDAETQTVSANLGAETCDASTQCGFVEAAGIDLSSPAVDVSVQRPATGRQADTAADTHTSGREGSGGEHTPQSYKKYTTGSLLGSKQLTNEFTNSSDGKVILQRPMNPFSGVLSASTGKEKGEGTDERGQQENGRLLNALPIKAREEVTSVNRLSEEAQTLQEIADILLLFKHRKKEADG